MHWQYTSGLLRTHSSIRVYRSDCGHFGMVRRTRGSVVQTRYFLWAAPDSAPEYATEGAARQARARALHQQRREEGR